MDAAAQDVMAWSRLGARGRINGVRRQLRDPRALVRSLQISRRVGGDPLDLPVLAGPTARLERHETSEILLGGHLFLGYMPDKHGRRRRMTFGTRPTFVTLGPGAQLATGGWVVVGDGGQIKVRGSLSVGEGTFLNNDVRIVARRAITIGRDCGISWEVLIMDTDMHPVAVAGEQREPTAPVSIGDHVWIGARATVLKGVSIGDGAVVAAQSVVVSDVPSRALVAGSPARVVRTDVDWG